jgi:hypothetical protein
MIDPMGLIFGILCIIAGILHIRYVFVVRNRTWDVSIARYTFKVSVFKKQLGPYPYDWISFIFSAFLIFVGVFCLYLSLRDTLYFLQY